MHVSAPGNARDVFGRAHQKKMRVKERREKTNSRLATMQHTCGGIGKYWCNHNQVAMRGEDGFMPQGTVVVLAYA